MHWCEGRDSCKEDGRGLYGSLQFNFSLYLCERQSYAWLYFCPLPIVVQQLTSYICVVVHIIGIQPAVRSLMDGRNLTPEAAVNRSTDLQRPIDTSDPREHRDHEDLEDAQPFSSTEHAQLSRRRGSDAATLRTLPRQQLTGSIRVDRSRVNVGETVGVVWDVSGRGVDGVGWNHNDFLGLFEVTEGGAPIDAENLLDSRLRGFNSSQSGRINWTIQSDHLHGRTSIM